jgi:outer membrane protein
LIRARLNIAVAAALAASLNANAADLVDVFRQAQSSDAVYAGARATWAAAQERIPQGRAGLLPQASISANTLYNDRTVTFRNPLIPGSSTQFNSNAITLNITQPIFRRQNRIAYEQAHTQVDQADAQFAQAAQDLILRVAQGYFDVLLAQDNVALAQAQKAAIGQQLEQAKRNFEVGTATITDTHEAQARYDLTVSQEIASQNDLEIRRRGLEQIIAQPAPPLAPLSTRLALRPPQPAVMDTWVDEARRTNLQVRAAEAGLQFATQNIERNRSGHYPTVDAIASYQDQAQGAGISGVQSPGFDARVKAIGLQVTIPIYQGGLVNSQVREAIANEDRARQDLENARRTAEFNVRQAYLGVSSGLAQVQALQAALVSSESQLESTRLGQQVGVRTQVDVLNAQQQLYTARRDLAQARYNYVLSLLRLKGAIGQLTEEDIVDINRWLGNT